ncbi:MAG: hypothetical protein ABUT20_66200, partial [Bacteroidota bacterium]
MQHTKLYTGIKITVFLLALLLTGGGSVAQQQLSVRELSNLADSLYGAKNYPSATVNYLAVASLSDFKTKKSGALYNAACCLSLQNKKDSAVLVLKSAIAAGYSNKKNLLADSDLKNLHDEAAWPKIVRSVKPTERVLNDDP